MQLIAPLLLACSPALAGEQPCLLATPGTEQSRADRLAETYSRAVKDVNHKHASKPKHDNEDALAKLLPTKARKAIDALLELEGADTAAAMTVAAEAALDLALMEDFAKLRSRLEQSSPDAAAELGTALARPRFLVRCIGEFEPGYLESFADDFDLILDAYADLFGAWEWSKVPGKKLRVRVHLEPEITSPPHFAPQYPFHSEIDFPVINPAELTSPTEAGQFLFYGLCHELGHVALIWGDRSNEEDHHTWAHYTGVLVVEHLSSRANSKLKRRLRDVRWRSLEREIEAHEDVEPNLETREGTMATWLALHEAFGPPALGNAFRFLEEENRLLRINHVRYCTFAHLRRALSSTLGKNKRLHKKLKAILPER